MKILVIGGTHFIGAYLTRELLEQGHEVVLLNRGKQTPFFAFDIETIHCDKRDIASKRSEIKRHSFDLAIDMVALNIANTQPVLTLLDGMIERICVISSADVYRVFDVIWSLDPSPVDNSALKEGSPLRRRLFPRNLIYKGEELHEMYDKIPVECLVQKLYKSSWAFRVELALSNLYAVATVADMTVAFAQNLAGQTDAEDVERTLFELEALAGDQGKQHLTDGD